MQYRCLNIITRLANGGAEETVFDMILELAKKGIYCDLAVGRESAVEVPEKYDFPKECSIYSIEHMLRNPKPSYDLKAVKEIRELIRKNNYNIVHTHGSKAGVLGRIAAYKEKVPAIVSTIHGISFPPAMSFLSRELYKNIERYTAKKTDALVCVGEDMKQKYLQARIGKESQYSVIYTGMNLEHFSKVKESSDKQRIEARKNFGLPEDLNTLVIGSIGRLEDRKNQKELIELLPLLLQEDKGFHLCLIGDGPNQEKLGNLARELGVFEYVTFSGYISQVWHILPAIDIHCMVSLWEGLPRVLVQTAAAGIANVCYEVDGAWEIIENDKSGYVIKERDVSILKDRVLELKKNKEKRKSFSEVAARLADSRWSLEKFGDDIESLYKNLLK